MVILAGDLEGLTICRKRGTQIRAKTDGNGRLEKNGDEDREAHNQRIRTAECALLQSGPTCRRRTREPDSRAGIQGRRIPASNYAGTALSKLAIALASSSWTSKTVRSLVICNRS